MVDILLLIFLVASLVCLGGIWWTLGTISINLSDVKYYLNEVEIFLEHKKGGKKH